MSRYFECGFAGSQLIDVTPHDDYEAKSSICDDDRQLSGLLYNMCIVLLLCGTCSIYCCIV